MGMKTLLIVLLIVGAAIAVLGLLVKALLWLAAVGLVLIAGTVAFWWARGRLGRSRSERVAA